MSSLPVPLRQSYSDIGMRQAWANRRDFPAIDGRLSARVRRACLSAPMVMGRSAHFALATWSALPRNPTGMMVADQVEVDRPTADRWQARKAAALAVTVAAALIPILVSIAAAWTVAHWIGPQKLGAIGWVLPGLVALAVVFLTERLCRRLLPLASLLKLTMAFPDQAPSRLSIALRTGTVRQLQRWANGLDTSDSATDVTAAQAAERVLTLAAALNTHDRRTRGHSERVRALTDLVGSDMGLSKHDSDRLRWAALLHDIGKLTVPAKILNKPGKPDAREWSLLQRHPEEGAKLIGPLAGWLGEWASAVDSHHERYDGAGYPRGLAGTDIPLAGRIVAVTDSFETMTAVRSYKRAMSFSDARAELQRCAGTHFDPAVVRLMYGVSLPRLLGALGPLAAVAHIPVVALLSQGGSVVPIMSEAARTAALAAAASIALTGIVAGPTATTASATPASSEIAAAPTLAAPPAPPAPDALRATREINAIPPSTSAVPPTTAPATNAPVTTIAATATIAAASESASPTARELTATNPLPPTTTLPPATTVSTVVASTLPVTVTQPPSDPTPTGVVAVAEDVVDGAVHGVGDLVDGLLGGSGSGHGSSGNSGPGSSGSGSGSSGSGSSGSGSSGPGSGGSDGGLLGLLGL
jgi:HD-GYP domain-containing protein (c-di-GMP phosphodiesterase class II)